MARETSISFKENNNNNSFPLANIITASYNIIGAVAGFVGLFVDSITSGLFLLIYPLLGIAIVFLSKGTIKLISDDKNLLNGSISMGFIISTLLMTFKSMDAYNLLQTANFWLPFSIIVVIVIMAFYLIGINPIDKKHRVDTIRLFMIGVLYSYGSTKEINCAFDISSPQVYNAAILGKRESRGRYASYYFSLSTWGPMTHVQEVEDNTGIYDHVKIGDTVKVNFKEGLLHIPWFVVTK